MGNRDENLELKYLKLLSTKFRNISETTIEIINLQAILNLPKGTEHFLTDIHGEYDAFHHVLKNGSGTIKEKINDIFKDELSNYDKKELASVIYYPTKKVDYIMKNGQNLDKWLKNTIYRMIEVCSMTASKYTSSKVRKAIVVMALMIFGYTAVVWSIIIFAPESLIKIFSSDADLLSDTVEALKLYFAAFIFMDLQYIGQTVFKSLNKKKQAIFFSLLRKVFIVVPLTYIMPYALNMGTSGVFMAEPVSNVIGGGICFVTMLCTVLPELKRMEKE